MKHLLFFVVGVALVVSAHAEAIAPTLKGDLVAISGKKAKKFDDTSLANAKHLAIYYSAHWCGPCRAFTPKLVEWYKANKPANPDFELIFVSSDHSEKEMEAYMAEAGMPWPALDFGKKGRAKSITKYAGRGIPCLVFLDADGKVLSHSYDGEKYVGPNKVLADMKKALKGGDAFTAATAPATSDPETTAAGANGETSGATTAKPPLGGATKSPQGSRFDEFFKKKP